MFVIIILDRPGNKVALSAKHENCYLIIAFFKTRPICVDVDIKTSFSIAVIITDFSPSQLHPQKGSNVYHNAEAHNKHVKSFYIAIFRNDITSKTKYNKHRKYNLSNVCFNSTCTVTEEII